MKTWTAFMSVVLLTGCVSFKYSNIGGGPTDLVNWEKVEKDAAEAGKRRRETDLARSGALVLPPDSAQALAMKKAFEEVASARRYITDRSPLDPLAPNYFFIGQRFEPFLKVRNEQGAKPPALLVVALDEPYAVTFADDTIVLSRRLADGLIGSDIESNYWSLRAIAAHELTHHYDGHAIFNWLATSGESQIGPRKAAAAISAITKILPLSVEYNFEPSSDYGDLKEHPTTFEFVADYWAFYTLKEMHAPPNTMLRTLRAIRDAMPPTSAESELVRQRAHCVNLLETPSSQKAIVVIDQSQLAVRVVARANIKAQMETKITEVAERSNIEKEINELPTATADALYLACATLAMVSEQKNPKFKAALHELFAADDREFESKFVTLFTKGLSGSEPFDVAYSAIMGGVPIVEPAMAYNRPRLDYRPNLSITWVGPVTLENGRDRIEVSINNSGRGPANGDFNLVAQREGEPEPLTSCSSDERIPTCNGVTIKGPLAANSTTTVVAYLSDPQAIRDGRRAYEFRVDDCLAIRTDSKAHCAIDESIETDNIYKTTIDRRPDLKIDALERKGAIKSTETGFRLKIENSGLSSISTPFSVTASVDRKPVELSSCSPETRAGGGNVCSGVQVRSLLAPGETIVVPAYVLSPDKGYKADNVTFHADGCTRTDGTTNDEDVCAIAESNERNNNLWVALNMDAP